MLTRTRRGLRFWMRTRGRPRRASVPGRKFSIKTSERSISCSSTASSSARLRSSEIPTLLRFTSRKYVLAPSTNGPNVRASSPRGGSTLITSAPRSASNMPQNGPARTLPSSSTRTPTKGGSETSSPDRSSNMGPPAIDAEIAASCMRLEVLDPALARADLPDLGACLGRCTLVGNRLEVRADPHAAGVASGAGRREDVVRAGRFVAVCDRRRLAHEEGTVVAQTREVPLRVARMYLHVLERELVCHATCLLVVGDEDDLAAVVPRHRGDVRSRQVLELPPDIKFDVAREPARGG